MLWDHPIENRAIHGEKNMPDVQAGFGKDQGTQYIIVDVYWIVDKAKKYKKKSACASSIIKTSFSYVNCVKLWDVLKKESPVRSHCPHATPM